MSDTNSQTKEKNIVLFPKTLDYYQIQLTVMLENERYTEAMSLLEFLLQCEGQEKRNHEEWEALLDWLRAAFPQYIDRDQREDRRSDEDLEESEEDFARQNARNKMAEDGAYADKLLRTVMEEPLSEQTMLALDQLAYIETPGIDQSLCEWLQQRKLHPLLQFRVLQTLRKRGSQATVSLTRGSEKVEVEVESIPLRPDEFPFPIIRVLELVADQTEVHEPTLFYFAQELWSQYVMAVYGTSDYRSMLEGDDSTLDIWAAALHAAVAESLGGSLDEEEIRRVYEITSEVRFRFEQAYRSIKRFVSGGLDVK
ncbi:MULTISPECIES: hypothetical protein [unclassified Paenibacillus]|uniref:Uncharacterized protein n=1 Tax=Paenibacillus provencensis TaxID=441151 RepID=A0ABW3QAB2_9BACL|nr:MULTISPECIES: hypothetical protein [unclassified Paenibacillus]MCM3129909.1 hypothetical protein [Paenibacillus sp. MER 78]SFS90937.1 hypothetical protein SAMN04488601_1072 [Paenibacillus sp. 453mf]